MNVLILSAAAKVPLVRAFAEAAHARGGRVLAADLGPDNAALFEADGAVILPRSDTRGFADALAAACAGHAVRLVVPTRDAELPVLAAARERLAEQGVTALVAGPDALATCQDKRRFTAACAAQGLATPRTYAPGEAPERFPVFVRPVTGAGGQGARRVDRAEDLPRGADLLVQALETDPEYTVDVLLDLAGRPLQAVARRRLQVRAGEAVKSRVEDAPELEEQALALCGALGLVGHNVVQAFHAPGRPPRFIEVNPRFGGASNLSIRAGLASPERILQMVEGRGAEAAAPRHVEYGLTMLRYPEDRFVTEAELAALAEG
ncbi:ATP-grasp domain-containing protein [Phenylobacterium sp.]|uniref:ATP-grasp domain-containing protein n=1 Tax=Phenylobacterium sp. TaxID=1871053 RepID=UPI002C02CB88|nr:ATP-grasp domain-containing protein [Phenylobacterium sp.]HVI33036.1 ATP-grasp domain-containing protein [Phenylobacterium sp.]